MDTMSKETQENLTPLKALDLLKKGNKRFIDDCRFERDLLRQVRETKKWQHPFAAILSCIDSRTSAELIFDQGIGDIFSVRLAGNVVNDDVLGSLEFSCKVAGAKLIVVLGHSCCGAIQGAVDQVHLGHLTTLLAKLSPAIGMVKQTISPIDPAFVANVTEAHIKASVKAILQQSEILNDMVAKGECAIIGAHYDLSSGEVIFYDDTLVTEST